MVNSPCRGAGLPVFLPGLLGIREQSAPSTFARTARGLPWASRPKGHPFTFPICVKATKTGLHGRFATVWLDLCRHGGRLDDDLGDDSASSAQMYQSSNSFGPVGYSGFNTAAGGGAMNGTNGGTGGSGPNTSGPTGGNNLGTAGSTMGNTPTGLGAPAPKDPVSSSLKHRRPTTPSSLGDPTLANEQVVDVRVVGVQGVSLQKIAPEIKTRAGRPFDADGIEEDVRRLTKTRLFVSVDTT